MFKLEVLFKENTTSAERKIAVLNQLNISQTDFDSKADALDQLLTKLFEGSDVMNDYNSLSDQGKGFFTILVCKKIASYLDSNVEGGWLQTKPIPEIVKNIFINFFTKADPSVTFAGFRTEIGIGRFLQWNFEKFPEAVQLFHNLKNHVNSNIEMSDHLKKYHLLIDDPDFWKVDNTPLNLPG